MTQLKVEVPVPIVLLYDIPSAFIYYIYGSLLSGAVITHY